HSAGTNLAARYTERHPDRVSSLVLVTPSAAAVGIVVSGEQRGEVVRLRRGEPWFEVASAAFERVVTGQATDDDWAAIAPFWYGRWDAVAQAHKAAEAEQKDAEISGAFAAEGAFAPEVTRAALGTFDAPVLLIAGEVDLNSVPESVAGYAGLFPNAEFVVQPGAGHFPWLDDPARFVATVEKFLG
ncbi:alpha/beta fold hydrolase, partial [Amycolatopsis sp. H20-H5]|uniref:alpha/beta fold hydrolase n=1 Tax=Amycolatopsis sp. H20-H5 TaxID=3046309 RepID=UPI002DB63879